MGPHAQQEEKGWFGSWIELNLWPVLLKELLVLARRLGPRKN